MNKINKIIAGLLFLTGITCFTGCIKEKGFDTPPDNPPSAGLTANMTLAQFNQYADSVNALSTPFVLITRNIIIKGVVIGNDQSGNIYKDLYLEDGTGGICIALDQKFLYATYPVGQTVYIKCQGLYLGNSYALPEIGYNNVGELAGNITQIPSTLISAHLFLDGFPQNPPAPTVETIPNLLTVPLSTLIELDSVHFLSTEIGKPFATEGVAGSTALYNVKGNSVVIYTSSIQYCPWAADPIPGGVGSVTAILTTYNGTPQLTLRDITDLKGFN
ncbi:MAG: DUF5689 domain-containing protein [Bacteroidales bacterium]|jgi:hypothetical protein